MKLDKEIQLIEYNIKELNIDIDSKKHFLKMVDSFNEKRRRKSEIDLLESKKESYEKILKILRFEVYF